MLRRLFFTNFKSWPSVDLECGAITGLFGPNSSGKTSILQFLLLLKQTKDATDRKLSLELNGDYVELGTIQDAIYRHNQQLSIDTVITFELSTPLTLADPATKSAVLASGRSLSLSTNIAVAHQAARTTRMNYELSGHQFELTLKSNSVARSKGGDYELKHAGDGDFGFCVHKVEPGDCRRQLRAMRFLTKPVPIFRTLSFCQILKQRMSQQ